MALLADAAPLQRELTYYKSASSGNTLSKELAVLWIKDRDLATFKPYRVVTTISDWRKGLWLVGKSRRSNFLGRPAESESYRP